MDSDEKAALAATIIAASTENIKRKKGGRERNGLNLGFNGDNRDILLPNKRLSVLIFHFI